MGKFKHLVDSEEGMRNFRTKYNILPNVGIRYAAQGEWFYERKTGEVVIPMIALIEGGMRRGYQNPPFLLKSRKTRF